MSPAAGAGGGGQRLTAVTDVACPVSCMCFSVLDSLGAQRVCACALERARVCSTRRVVSLYFPAHAHTAHTNARPPRTHQSSPSPHTPATTHNRHTRTAHTRPRPAHAPVQALVQPLAAHGDRALHVPAPALECREAERLTHLGRGQRALLRGRDGGGVVRGGREGGLM